jgi:cell division protein FtsB
MSEHNGKPKVAWSIDIGGLVAILSLVGICALYIVQTHADTQRLKDDVAEIHAQLKEMHETDIKLNTAVERITVQLGMPQTHDR